VISRRGFLTGFVIALAPLGATADAQEYKAGKVYRIGVLCPLACDGMTGLEPAFRLALRDLGYVEGRTLAFEYRAAEGQLDRLPALADELRGTRESRAGTSPPAACGHSSAHRA